MSIDKLKSALQTGARANKYKVFIPMDGADMETIDVLAKAASLPDVTITPIDVFNQGRKVPFAGDVIYAGTWDVTFWNSADMALRRAFEDWMTMIDDADAHTRAADALNDYIIDMKVQQLDGRNNSVAEYTIYNSWPTTISAIEVADESNDTITEFVVTFAYSHWKRTA